MERALKVQIIPAAPGFSALSFYMDDDQKPNCDRVSVIAWKLLIVTGTEIGVIDGKPQYGSAVAESLPVLPGIDDGFEWFDAIEHPGGMIQTKSCTFSNLNQWLAHEAGAHIEKAKSHISDLRKILEG